VGSNLWHHCWAAGKPAVVAGLPKMSTAGRCVKDCQFRQQGCWWLSYIISPAEGHLFGQPAPAALLTGIVT
jgi:hypothetical protein